MNFSNVGRFDKVKYSLECAVLVVVINELGPVSRGDGDKNIMKQVVAWRVGGGFCD